MSARTATCQLTRRNWAIDVPSGACQFLSRVCDCVERGLVALNPSTRFKLCVIELKRWGECITQLRGEPFVLQLTICALAGTITSSTVAEQVEVVVRRRGGLCGFGIAHLSNTISLNTSGDFGALLRETDNRFAIVSQRHESCFLNARPEKIPKMNTDYESKKWHSNRNPGDPRIPRQAKCGTRSRKTKSSTRERICWNGNQSGIDNLSAPERCINDGIKNVLRGRVSFFAKRVISVSDPNRPGKRGICCDPREQEHTILQVVKCDQIQVHEKIVI
jgi:hypothetical protein